MWAATKNTLQRHFLSNPSSSLYQSTRTLFGLRDYGPNFIANNVFDEMPERKKHGLLVRKDSIGCLNGSRFMSTDRGRSRGSSMRSKVEKKIEREVGRSQTEIRKARNLRKKLMTEEERLIWNLRRAKKKVAVLLQKLKKYELPDLPPPRHDPELFTPEQLQAYKKIGFKNKNYVPVGIRGVFGGVVQNMHLHWKFHETVQVCCDNFPKEKIKEMATMLARLSGGIVVNIHDVKTIIMFRGRNYRQPKNLIPINTLTKRKALFKARFEQALDSQKLNIKKIEQDLRRKGVNPEDPVAMASIHRVASTFFNAIDDKQGSPYVFHGEKQWSRDVRRGDNDDDGYNEEKEQHMLDKFIADIEEAAEQEWEDEEAAEREEFQRIKYKNREHSAGRIIRADRLHDDEDEGVHRDTDRRRRVDNDDEDDEEETGPLPDKWGSNLDSSDEDEPDEPRDKRTPSRMVNQKHNKINGGDGPRGHVSEDDSSSGFEDLWESDDNENPETRDSKEICSEFMSGSNDDDVDEYEIKKSPKYRGVNGKRVKTVKQADEDWDSD
ncbi:hypothetical protein ACHQM5_011046 [Ranunculus cassubicifolius]